MVSTQPSLSEAPTRPLQLDIVDYWNERACTYSNSIWDELRGARAEAWAQVLYEKLGCPARAGAEARPRVLDLGSGPGFFSILLSLMGFRVQAVDSSEQMLAYARKNVACAGDPCLVDFAIGDVANLPFASRSYDALVLRNVTWLMRDPVAAYAEWLRLLKPGGKLLVFDANWYTYLVDARVNARRLSDQSDAGILAWSENAFASAKQERRCEEIARALPLTYEVRPAWDAWVLTQLGFSSVAVDEEVYKRVWTKGEQAFYATSPLFSIEAVK